MKVAVVGAGYVGLSNAVLLAQNNPVYSVDTNKTIVDQINNQESHISDADIEYYLKNKDLNLTAITDAKTIYPDVDIVIIATPTNYDESANYFDTSSVDSVIEETLTINPDAFIVIKSTVPVGYTKEKQDQYPDSEIVFSPEFLREGEALHDNLNPSRIIVGSHSDKAQKFADLLKAGANKEDVPVLFMESTEAEAVKLFANSYLAMRVAFFNELDTYAEVRDLNTASIIEGIGLDPRIGTHYNNPSFGYGGYCLPKDTKQLLANFGGVPNELVGAIVASNATRKDFITESIAKNNPKTVGIYRLTMKQDSDNFRESAVLGIMDRLTDEGIAVVIYEPTFEESHFNNYKVLNDLNEFKTHSDLIITNRQSEDLDDVSDKVYTRDLYHTS